MVKSLYSIIPLYDTSYFNEVCQNLFISSLYCTYLIILTTTHWQHLISLFFKILIPSHWPRLKSKHGQLSLKTPSNVNLSTNHPISDQGKTWRRPDWRTTIQHPNPHMGRMRVRMNMMDPRGSSAFNSNKERVFSIHNWCNQKGTEI